MFFAFFFLLLFDGAVGIVVWLAWQRVSAHLRRHPEAARLFAECVIAPLLTGSEAEEPQITLPVKPEVQKTKGTLV